MWFQMGKIFKRLDLLEDALLHFNHALDLQPSSGTQLSSSRPSRS